LVEPITNAREAWGWEKKKEDESGTEKGVTMKWFTENIYNPLANIPPVFIDGFLYFLIAVFGASIGILSEDDAYKYINEFVLYHLKFWVKVGLAGATALKMFRSTSYSEHYDKTLKKEAEDKPAELLKKHQAAEEEAKLLAVRDAAKLAEVKAELKTDAPKI
jgi:hypothetical protein